MLNRITDLAGRVLAVVRSIPLAAALAIHQFFWNP
jgi:hypothetical protein